MPNSGIVCFVESPRYFQWLLYLFVPSGLIRGGIGFLIRMFLGISIRRGILLVTVSSPFDGALAPAKAKCAGMGSEANNACRDTAWTGCRLAPPRAAKAAPTQATNAAMVTAEDFLCSGTNLTSNLAFWRTAALVGSLSPVDGTEIKVGKAGKNCTKANITAQAVKAGRLPGMLMALPSRKLRLKIGRAHV